MTTETKFFCHHEAAHAVVGSIFGLRILSIYVDVEKRTGGVKFDTSEFEKLTAIEQAIIFQSGRIAEIKLNPAQAMDRTTSSGDMKDLYDIANRTFSQLRKNLEQEDWDNLIDLFFDALYRWCEPLIDTKWTKICALADRLEQSPQMSGEEAELLIG